MGGPAPSAPPGGLRPFPVLKRWGYIDRTGTLAVPARYDYVRPFSEGLAAVLVNGEWSYIDETGHERFRAGAVRSAGFFREGLAVLESGAYGSRVCTVVDRDGAVVWSRVCEIADSCYSEARICYTDDSKQPHRYGYLDRAGEVAIPAVSTIGRRFSEGKVPAIIDGKAGFLGPNGEIAIPFQFDSVELGFQRGLARVTVNGEPRVIDAQGRFASPPFPFPIDEGFAVVELNEYSCERATLPRCLAKPTAGLTAVLLDSSGTVCAYVDATGATIAGPFSTRSAVSFYGGHATVNTNRFLGGLENWHVLDRDGSLIPIEGIYPTETDMYSIGHFIDGLAAVYRHDRTSSFSFPELTGYVATNGGYLKASVGARHICPIDDCLNSQALPY